MDKMKGSKPEPHAGTSVVAKKRPKVRRGFLSLTSDRIIKVATCFWEELDTPVSLGLSLRVKYGLWREIAEARIDPLNYTDSKKFFKDYSAVNFLRKYRELPAGFDHKDQARQKFRAAEIVCKETNHLIHEWLGGRLSPRTTAVNLVMYQARWKVRNLLGSVNLEEISDMMRWGPGATSANRGELVSAYHKFDAAPECTLGALPLAKAAINSCPTWASAVVGVDFPCSVLDSVFRVVPGNRVTYVPKDAVTDRVIAIEPHMNIYMQLGVGGVIRRKLKKVGVDLDDQTRNQTLAKQAYTLGLATVDLSSASDTISRELVEFLLPQEWFRLLERLRSVNGDDEGSGFKRYEKFSSMGNGFTFELESLIFWALSSAVLQQCHLHHDTFGIYGDDIVVPASAYPLLSEVFNFSGFTVNHRKSYHFGSFYESCGKHYFEGLDVSPVYLKDTPSNILELFGLINQITALSGRLFGDGFSLPRTRSRLISYVAKRDRVFGPLGYGDGFIHGSFVECTPFTRVQENWVEGFIFLHFVPIPKRVVVSSRAALTWGLYRLRPVVKTYMERTTSHKRLSLFSKGTEVLRGDAVRFKLARLEVPRPTYVGFGA
jgi:hypothetical protein